MTKEWFDNEKKIFLENGGDEKFIEKLEIIHNELYCEEVDSKRPIELIKTINKIIEYDFPFGGPLNECSKEHEDEWKKINKKHYQNKRCPSLIKSFCHYIDFNRAICFNVRTNEIYEGDIEQTIINELFPIEFPYVPIYHGYKIFTFNYGNEIISIRCVKCPDGEVKEIGKFLLFVNQEWKEVTEKEFIEAGRKWIKENKGEKS